MLINEIAQLLHITPRAIRLYEKKGLLKPERNDENGYRSYTEHDAWRLQTIASLRSLGLGLEQIEALLQRQDSGSFEDIHHALELQRMNMMSRWLELKQAISCMDDWIERLEKRKRLDLRDLFELTEKLKQARDSASAWQDRWDFDTIAERYDDEASSHAIGPMVPPDIYEQTLTFMTQWIAPAPGETGLDIGTGTGNLAAKLLQHDVTMCAIDQSREMLDRCRDKYPAIRTKLGNSLSIPYVGKAFHFVASAFAFHHLSESQQLLALEEMNRVLQPNGRICISSLMYEPAAGIDDPFPQWAGNGISDKHPANRAMVLQWFRDRSFITVQQQMNEYVHVVYAVRRN